MITPSIGWATSVPSVFRTTDGGRRWSDVTPRGYTAGREAGGTQFLDERHAWLTVDEDGRHALILRTSDAGRTWQRARVLVTDPQYFSFGGVQIDFVDPHQGWLMPYEGGMHTTVFGVFRTMDDGAHWTKIAAHQPFAQLLGFPTPSIGYAAVNAGGGAPAVPGALYMTRDGGRTWQSQALSVPTGYRTSTIILTPPVFSDAQDGIITEIASCPQGRRDAALVVYGTLDGGQSWHAAPPLDIGTRTPNVVIDFVSSRRGWLVTATGLYTTGDRGQHWTTVPSTLRLTTAQTANPLLDFVTNRLGFALIGPRADHGFTTLFKTTDGGDTWRPIQPQVGP